MNARRNTSDAGGANDCITRHPLSSRTLPLAAIMSDAYRLNVDGAENAVGVRSAGALNFSRTLFRCAARDGGEKTWSLS